MAFLDFSSNEATALGTMDEATENEILVYLLVRLALARHDRPHLVKKFHGYDGFALKRGVSDAVI